ncbi:MAG: DUF5688 family protein [Clostridium sp.]|nr:DUF5688 family protein [Clostridium sp.]
MEMKVFITKVKRGILKKLGTEIQVEVREVYKNNGLVLHGLMITKPGRNVARTIYLEDLLEWYEQGTPLSVVIDKILSLYEEEVPGENVDMGFLKDFSKVKEQIVYKIVNAEKNKDLLKRIPHICFLDLAICFSYFYVHKTLGNGMILVYNTHVEMWNTNTAELFHLAQENTPRLSPPEFRSVRQMMDSSAQSASKRESLPLEAMELRVLSNVQHSHGAACILYPGVLRQISQFLSPDFFILPSSIHEVILLAAESEEGAESLRGAVREVNAARLEAEQILSDSVYYYDHRQNKLKIV